MTEYPKVLVGCPTCDLYDFCLEEYVTTVKSFDYPNFEVWFVDNSKDNKFFEKLKGMGLNVVKDKWQESIRDRIVSSRNILRQKVLDGKFDFFFSLEQDVMPATKDVIQRLLRHGKKVVSGLYFKPWPNKNGTVQLYAVMWNWVDPKYKEIYSEKVADIPKDMVERRDKLFAIKTAGLGCLLIHKDVLKNIKFRYDKEFSSFDNIHFSRDVRESRETIFADPTAVCHHRFNKPQN